MTVGTINIKKMNDHVYLMDESGEATGYVVVGSRKALIIDTMMGYSDVKVATRTVTDLPLMVVNTHGHCDHIFGNIYFDEAYLNPLDRPIANEHTKMPGFVAASKEKGLAMSRFKDIHDGDVIDLGGLTLDVIELPGHTPGSILLLLREDRILFTGDAVNRHLWLQLEHSLPLDECCRRLEAVQYLSQKADYILHGHASDFEPITLLGELLDGLKDLIAGNTQNDTDYEWFDKKRPAKLHPFGDGDSAIIYHFE